MKYSDVIRFITDCLVLSIHSNGRERLQNYMESNQIDWEKVVQVSSNHLVLPSLYVQLKQAKLLELLPEDLQSYMGQITALNRDRNQKNIEQVEELNTLFLAHNIQPIYLKGTAHLLEGLYLDIGERMIGDIDLIVAPEKMEKAADLLAKNGYAPMSTYSAENFVRTKHYPRMIHKNKMFAVEIHKDVVQKVSNRQLNFERINLGKRSVNGCYLPSYADLILHNMMNTQLNDQGFLYMSINLRQKYDLLLLSQYEQPIVAIENFQFHQLTLKSYLVKSACMFRGVKELAYPKNIWTYWVKLLMCLKLKFPKPMRFLSVMNFIIYRIYRDIGLAIEFLPHKKTRSRILKYLLFSEYRKVYFQNIYNQLRSM